MRRGMRLEKGDAMRSFKSKSHHVEVCNVLRLLTMKKLAFNAKY